MTKPTVQRVIMGFLIRFDTLPSEMFKTVINIVTGDKPPGHVISRVDSRVLSGPLTPGHGEHELSAGPHTRPGQLFSNTAMGAPDGIKVDCHGRVYIGETNGQGVVVHSANGELLGVIKVPGGVSGVVLVPDKANTGKTHCIMMAQYKIYRVILNTPFC
eukprot:g10895.t1